MSSLTPWELIWVAHSKPASQKERNNRLLGVMSRVAVFAWNYILLPLVLHQTFAPFPFRLVIAIALRSAGGHRDLLNWKLRHAVGKKQSIRLLVGIGELRVAEARENWERPHDTHQMKISPRQVLL